MKISFVLDESIRPDTKKLLTKEIDGTIDIFSIDNLSELMTETNVIHSVHKDNIKINETFMFTHFIAYDIDADLPLSRALELVKNYNHVIATSQSHQKQKGDSPPCDRYRIVIQLKNKIESVDHYHYAYDYFRDKILKLIIKDNCMRTPHQYMKKHREVISVKNDGILFDAEFLNPKKIFIPKSSILDMELRMAKDTNSNPPDEILVRKVISNIIKNADESIEGNNGDKITFQVACEIYRWNGNFNDLKTYNNFKCKPKWSDKELRHKWDNAVKSVGKMKYGNYRMKQKIKEIETCK